MRKIYYYILVMMMFSFSCYAKGFTVTISEVNYTGGIIEGTTSRIPFSIDIVIELADASVNNGNPVYFILNENAVSTDGKITLENLVAIPQGEGYPEDTEKKFYFKEKFERRKFILKGYFIVKASNPDEIKNILESVDILLGEAFGATTSKFEEVRLKGSIYNPDSVISKLTLKVTDMNLGTVISGVHFDSNLYGDNATVKVTGQKNMDIVIEIPKSVEINNDKDSLTINLEYLSKQEVKEEELKYKKIVNLGENGQTGIIQIRGYGSTSGKSTGTYSGFFKVRVVYD